MVYLDVSIVVPALDEIMNKPNVLFISYDSMTDPLGQSQVIPYLQGLVANGFAISLLSCEKPEVYDTGKENIRAILKESNISWRPIIYTKKPPVLSTLYDIYQLKKKKANATMDHGPPLRPLIMPEILASVTNSKINVVKIILILIWWKKLHVMYFVSWL